MHENPFQFFDNILRELSKDYNKTFTVNELTDLVLPIKTFENISEKEDNMSAVLNALMFLNNEGLVALDIEKGLTFINTKGFIKIKTKGFVAEFKEAKRTISIQRFNQIATPIIALLALIISIYNLFFKEVPNTNRKINDTYKYENTK